MGTETGLDVCLLQENCKYAALCSILLLHFRAFFCELEEIKVSYIYTCITYRSGADLGGP